MWNILRMKIFSKSSTCHWIALVFGVTICWTWVLNEGLAWIICNFPGVMWYAWFVNKNWRWKANNVFEDIYELSVQYFGNYHIPSSCRPSTKCQKTWVLACGSTVQQISRLHRVGNKCTGGTESGGISILFKKPQTWTKTWIIQLQRTSATIHNTWRVKPGPINTPPSREVGSQALQVSCQLFVPLEACQS